MRFIGVEFTDAELVQMKGVLENAQKGVLWCQSAQDAIYKIDKYLESRKPPAPPKVFGAEVFAGAFSAIAELHYGLVVDKELIVKEYGFYIPLIEELYGVKLVTTN
jgi:hypothetical protein